MSFNRDTYPTAPSVFAQLNAEFGFTLDGAALPHNAKCDRYITPEMDFLTYPLSNERIFVNPPYSKPLPFVARAVELFEQRNCLVVMLLPVDVSTQWFELITQKATELRFVVGGRMRFPHPATGKFTDVCRGNHIAIFNPDHKNQAQLTRYVSLDDFGQLEWRKKAEKA